MTYNPTLEQSGEDRSQARRLSQQRQAPPVAVPGYQPLRLLGAGGYGEVWLARDSNTSREVAIKFYTHRGGLDWSLLSREVEKLAFLFNDRFVVQLLQVGWDAEPPYYVMEYLPLGSLEERLAAGPVSVSQALSWWRDVATGLVHAHGKGVLHCDLKPANVLLDHDGRPRLADFGQSRLSHEQAPALGTLFYMAPEQANLAAIPDARWDVYALGALFYALVTGEPPYRREAGCDTLESATHLEDRLARYRQMIQAAPRAAEHRAVPGVDRGLADIVDRCLAIEPERRLPNAQAVLDALSRRQARQARRPLVMLGAVGPLLLLAVLGGVGWLYFRSLLGQTDDALRRQALENNRFAARFVAANMGFAVEQRLRAVTEAATDRQLAELLARAAQDRELPPLTAVLNDPSATATEEDRERFRQHPLVRQLQQRLSAISNDNRELSAASWFVSDADGLHFARQPARSSIGQNYAWRAYFHGGDQDLPKSERPLAEQHLRSPRVSAAFRSDSTGELIVAVSAPIVRDGGFLGVVAMTVQVGRFTELDTRIHAAGSAPVEDLAKRDRFAVLVDNRPGPQRGLILHHQVFNDLVAADRSVPTRFDNLRVHLDMKNPTNDDFVDVLSRDDEARDYRRRWLAAFEPVAVRGVDSGLVVVVQESYDEVIGKTLAALASSLLRTAGLALALAAGVMVLLWTMVLGLLSDGPRWSGLRRRWKLGPESGLASSTGATPGIAAQPATEVWQTSRDAGGSALPRS